MSTVIAVANHKGGVGKTTTVASLGAGLSKKGKKVLLIDLDPQANLTQSFSIQGSQKTIYGALRGIYGLNIEMPLKKNLGLIPSTLDLSGAETELSSETGREYILKELIEPARASYDYILIDAPPSLGLLTLNALASADQLLIPIEAQYLALQGLTKLLEVTEKIKKRINPKLRICGVLITKYDKRKILNREVGESIAEHFKDKAFKIRIRDNVALAEAPAQGKDIFAYSPKSYGAQDYEALTKEILKGSKSL